MRMIADRRCQAIKGEGAVALLVDQPGVLEQAEVAGDRSVTTGEGVKVDVGNAVGVVVGVGGEPNPNVFSIASVRFPALS